MSYNNCEPLYPLRLLLQGILNPLLYRLTPYPVIEFPKQTYGFFCSVLPYTIRTFEEEVVTSIMRCDGRCVEDREVAYTR